MKFNNNPVFIKGKIIENRHLQGDYYHIVIKAPKIAKKARPGQFVMLSKWSIKNLLLKRPFSVNSIDVNQGLLSLLYKKVGKGTQILSESRPKELIELIGPLGNGFSIPEEVKIIAIVGRGIGVATLMPLVEECHKKGIEVYSFLSAKEEKLLLSKEKIEALSIRTFYTTDDGSKGIKGKVTTFLEELLKDNTAHIGAVYTCGSKRLAWHIRELQKDYHFAAYISLEERMSCGIGACKGCVINTIYGYQRVCKEGPVFPLEEVIFDEK